MANVIENGNSNGDRHGMANEEREMRTVDIVTRLTFCSTWVYTPRGACILGGNVIALLQVNPLIYSTLYFGFLWRAQD